MYRFRVYLPTFATKLLYSHNVNVYSDWFGRGDTGGHFLSSLLLHLDGVHGQERAAAGQAHQAGEDHEQGGGQELHDWNVKTDRIVKTKICCSCKRQRNRGIKLAARLKKNLRSLVEPSLTKILK